MMRTNKPDYTFDPGADMFLSVVRRSTYTDASHEEQYSNVDIAAANPNYKAMTDLTRQEVDAKLAQNKAEVDARLANFDTSIKTGFADLRAEFAEMRAEMAKQTGEMRAEMANVRADSHKATTEVTRWVVGFGIAILGAIFGFAKYSDKPTAPAAVVAQPSAQQQAPLVIAVPPGSTVLSAPQAPAAPPAK